ELLPTLAPPAGRHLRWLRPLPAQRPDQPGPRSAGAPTIGVRLEVRDLTVRFDAVAALNGVSLDVASGERRAIIGPTGAGKTTLFNPLTGDGPPDAGSILLDRRDATRLPSWRRARLGLARTFQRSTLFPELTVAQNLALAVRLRTGLAWRFWPGGEGALAREVDQRLAAARLEAVAKRP